MANSTATRRAGVYQKIAAVWDKVPDTFHATELYELAGIKRHNQPGHRMLIASILTESFRARQIRPAGGGSFWRKS